MKIVKLIAENVKGLKAVEIVPDEHFQIISGANGQGKSSVLDSIWYALGGGGAIKGTDKPIREGEESANVVLDLGDMVVTRRWTSNDRSNLKVETKDGAKYSSPQAVLDKLIGRLSFDPLAFSNLPDKEQLKTLLELVDIDPTPLEEKRKELFDQRTEVNREVKRYTNQIEAYPLPSDDIPDEEVSSTTILDEMRKAQEIINSNNEKRREYQEVCNAYRKAESDLSECIAEQNRIQEEINRLKERLNTVNEEAFAHEKDMNQLKQRGSKLKLQTDGLNDPDLSVFRERLENIEVTNAAVRQKKQRNQLVEQLHQVTNQSDELTEQIVKVDEEKQKLMQRAEFPIEGLSFDESGVLYKGVPLKQCSSAERLKVSMAMAMALNPKLRVIRILDGSLLDSSNLKVIQEMAQDKDYQVFVECVDESGTMGIVIEAGEVKERVEV